MRKFPEESRAAAAAAFFEEVNEATSVLRWSSSDVKEQFSISPFFFYDHTVVMVWLKVDKQNIGLLFFFGGGRAIRIL